MTDRDALLKAILAQPGEDTPRLAYADLLDELAGTPTERAEFIRIQIRHRRERNIPQSLVEREYDLLLRNWHEWLGRPKWIKATKPWCSDYFEPAINFQHRRHTPSSLYHKPMTQVLFLRGFAAEVKCEDAWWDEYSPVLALWHPGVARSEM